MSTIQPCVITPLFDSVSETSRHQYLTRRRHPILPEQMPFELGVIWAAVLRGDCLFSVLLTCLIDLSYWLVLLANEVDRRTTQLTSHGRLDQSTVSQINNGQKSERSQWEMSEADKGWLPLLVTMGFSGVSLCYPRVPRSHEILKFVCNQVAK